MSEIAAALEETIRSGKARVGTIGLGYVGLPLSVEFASGWAPVVTGFDLSRPRSRPSTAASPTSRTLPGERLAAAVKRRAGSGRRPTSTSSATCDAVVICVPTPLSKTKDPDLSDGRRRGQAPSRPACGRDS